VGQEVAIARHRSHFEGIAIEIEIAGDSSEFGVERDVHPREEAEVRAVLDAEEIQWM